MSELKLADNFIVTGFGSEADMAAWIQKFNSMDGEDVPPPFDECCAYKGLSGQCESKEDWVERDGKMDSGGFWYRPYDGSRYCKNHYKWSFETALTAIGNPKYIIVVNLKPHNYDTGKSE